MPFVYVVGALIPRGGAFMGYHVGLVLEKEFGYSMVNVQVGEKTPAKQFDYPTMPPTITIPQMEKRITKDDLIVVNPSFSKFMFGLRLPGRKISYVQGFQTYQVLDCRFDLYVSVSALVQEFLRGVYGIETSVIPAFVQLKKLPNPMPWKNRPPMSALMYIKEGMENQVAAQYVRHQLKTRLPNLKLDVIKNSDLPHVQFMKRIAAVRYFINISLAEGFGLISLEAMALGTFVTGLDGQAGRDYLRFGENSKACSFKDIDHVPAIIAQCVSADKSVEAMTAQAMQDALKYDLASFRASWTQTLKKFLG